MTCLQYVNIYHRNALRQKVNHATCVNQDVSPLNHAVNFKLTA